MLNTKFKIVVTPGSEEEGYNWKEADWSTS